MKNKRKKAAATNKINVAIADDHKLIASMLKKLINETRVAHVVGVAHSVAECRDMLKDAQPDVLLLDVSMPDGSGIDLCPRIKAKYPAVKVLMLTSYSEFAIIASALDAGADGYVLKNSLPEEILEGIQEVASGSRFLCDEVNLIFKVQEDNPLELTRREYNLLRLIAEDCTNAEIADRLCLGYETIKSYRKNLNAKFEVHNTAQLLQKAKALKLL